MTPTADQPQQLLDDLQAIQELLESPAIPVATPPLPDDVPLLCDVVLPAAEPSAEAAARPFLDATRPGATLTPEVRAQASLIVQQVIDEFMPRIEAEVRLRLEASLDALRRPPHD